MDGEIDFVMFAAEWKEKKIIFGGKKERQKPHEQKENYEKDNEYKSYLMKFRTNNALGGFVLY